MSATPDTLLAAAPDSTASTIDAGAASRRHEPPPAPSRVALSFAQRLAWSLGAVAENCIGNAIVILTMPIYNLGLGVSAVWLGWALAVPRILDAVIDPFIGNLSDNTRGRWGRRRPYVAISALTCAILFALLWFPPLGWSKAGQFAYFCAITIPFMISFGFFAIPYGALGLELSDDINERTRIMGWRCLFANGIALLFPWFYQWSRQLGVGAPQGVPQEIIGVRYVGLGIAAVILVFGLIPAIFSRERAAAQAQPEIKLKEAVRLTVRNRPFLMITGINLLSGIGAFLVSPLLLYISVSHICQGDKDLAAKLSGLGGTLYSVGGMIASVAIGWVGARWGKRRVIIGSLIVTGAAFVSTYVCYTPRYPYLQLIPSLVLAPGLMFIQILANSLMADICDVDELESGLRREGMFGAVGALIFKAGLGLSSVLGGYIISLSGFVDGAATQTPEALFNMRVMYAILPTLLIVISLIMAIEFPIDERKMREVRAQLDARAAAREAAAAEAGSC